MGLLEVAAAVVATFVAVLVLRSSVTQRGRGRHRLVLGTLLITAGLYLSPLPTVAYDWAVESLGYDSGHLALYGASATSLAFGAWLFAAGLRARRHP